MWIPNDLLGNDTNKFWPLKHKIQDFIDTDGIVGYNQKRLAYHVPHRRFLNPLETVSRWVNFPKARLEDVIIRWLSNQDFQSIWTFTSLICKQYFRCFVLLSKSCGIIIFVNKWLSRTHVITILKMMKNVKKKEINKKQKLLLKLKIQKRKIVIPT